MSRVEEALRLAEGKPRTAIGAGAESGPSAFEAFPTEEVRQLRAAARPAARELSVAPALILPRKTIAAPVTRLAPAVEGKVVIDGETSSASVEEYRRLATGLHLAQAEKGLRALLVSSALPRDGKTLTSTNLALTFSESYKRRVLLIDADLRRPSLHEVFRVSNTVGLADCLRTDGLTAPPMIQVSGYLTVIPAGAADSSPMAGLTSDTMRAIITQARDQFDWVIVDTPPVGLISDASLMASLVDGVLLVIGASSTPYAAVKRAVSEFGADRILGVVLNRVSEEASSNRYYTDYYGGDRYGAKDGVS